MNTSDCILLAILLAFSAYFSASETALSTVNKIRLKSYADNGSKKAKQALDMAENFDRTLSTILVGNNVVNTASAALMTTVTTALFGATGAVIATAVTTVLVLIFGEILPKTYAKENSEKLALTIAAPMHFLIVLLTPVVPAAAAADGAPLLQGGQEPVRHRRRAQVHSGYHRGRGRDAGG